MGLIFQTGPAITTNHVFTHPFNICARGAKKAETESQVLRFRFFSRFFERGQTDKKIAAARLFMVDYRAVLIAEHTEGAGLVGPGPVFFGVEPEMQAGFAAGKIKRLFKIILDGVFGLEQLLLAKQQNHANSLFPSCSFLFLLY